MFELALSLINVFSAFFGRNGKSHFLVPEADDVFAVGDLLAEFERLLGVVGRFVVEAFVLVVSLAQESHSLAVRFVDLLGQTIGVFDLALDILNI